MGSWFVFGVVSLVGIPLLVLIHELGHAVAVLLRGLPLQTIAVGDRADLVIRTRGLVVRLGRMLDDGPTGFVRYDASRASARDVLVVALAGPAANVATAPAFAIAAMAGGTHGALDTGLWLLAACSLLGAIGDLIPRRPLGSSGLLNDGRVAQIAWSWGRTGRLPTLPQREAAPAAPATPPKGMRWPFAVALLLVAVLALAVAGPGQRVARIVVFGVALLQGAHRRKAW